MGLEKQSKQIGEYTYEVTMLGTKLGNRVLLKLMKSVAPVFFATAGAGMSGGTISTAIAGLNEDDFDWVVLQLATSTDVTLAPNQAPRLTQIFDMHFAGRYMQELEWLEFAIEVNFGPFFLELKRKAAAAKAAQLAARNSAVTPTPSTSTSPSTSTGESSAS